MIISISYVYKQKQLTVIVGHATHYGIGGFQPG